MIRFLSGLNPTQQIDVPDISVRPEYTKQLLINVVDKIAHIVIAAYQLKAPKQTS